jgi:transcriptional regulator with XRE-family HTH domain
LKSLHTLRSQELRRRLRDARLAAGVTQQDLAARLQVPQSFVSKFETGERRLDVVEFTEVCEAIEVNAVTFLADLLDGTAKREAWT